MRTRVHLRSPDGESVVRDVVGEYWSEGSSAIPDTELGKGLYALPGLIDAHAHLATSELNWQPGVFEEAVDRARASLRAGVTLVLDKGWRDATTIRVIDELAPHERPDIEAAAQIIASPGGYYPDFGYEVEEGRLTQAVLQKSQEGRGWVKLVGDWPRKGVGPKANFSLEAMKSAVRAAHDSGSRVAIHTMAPEVPSAAVEAGIDSIEHGLFMTEADVETLAERRGMWVPTVLRAEAVLAQLGAESSGGRLFVQGLENVRRLLPLAAEAGVEVLAGTDLVGSPVDVAAEAIALSRFGLSNSQILRAVSSGGFLATGRPARFEVGAPADAVFFADNPLGDLDVLAHPVAVMRLGRVV